MTEERWDIYDGCKRLTGRTMRRNDWNMKPGDYHLTVLGAVRRPDGKFLITRRSANKRWAPGAWEIPGGGVQAGETSRDAVLREVLEETGLDVSEAEGGFVFDYHREDAAGDNYFVDIYLFTLDFDPADVKLQPEETDGFRLATAGEIGEIAAEGQFLHYGSIRRIFSEEGDSGH